MAGREEQQGQLLELPNQLGHGIILGLGKASARRDVHGVDDTAAQRGALEGAAVDVIAGLVCCLCCYVV